ncbi:hypothetical protein BDQ17DRAFT_1425491 [Cyathus striatus]|nr:hypothetical protein BDQ17DRAFT_1425491 [Cyathus striatus]
MSSVSPSDPVAVFVGGTSGIGQGMAEAFNRHVKGNGHIVIVGRNREAAEGIIEKMKSVHGNSSKGTYEFIPVEDASLMSSVKSTSSEILSKYPKINYLIMSAGYMSPHRSVTSEGHDKKTALQYYSRWAFIHHLLPSLKTARDSKEDVRVMTVYGAGKGGDINVDDLGFKKDLNAAVNTAGVTYNDLMIEEYALRNPGILFTHSYPGAVRTNLLRASDSALLRFGSMLSPLLYPFTVSQEECAENMWSGLHSCDVNKPGSTGIHGAYRIGNKGEDIGVKGYFGSAEKRKLVWEFTAKETGIDDA